MKKFLLLLSLMQHVAFAQKCDAIKCFDEVFGISYFVLAGKKLPQKDLAKYTRVDNCLAKIVPNQSFLKYLQEHFSKKIEFGWFSDYTDSLKTRKEYLDKLKQDKEFVELINNWVAKIENPKTKDTISFDELLGIAVKYFSLNMNKDEKYTIKICSGINDILKTEATRKPFLEAFCFASIYESSVAKGQYDMSKEVATIAKELYKINLGVERQERILRAQGALYMLMRKNDALQKMLLSNYEKQKDKLPFILKM
ncbi:MAG: hypothetical protein OHK0045_00050 [Raineya sp.]